jgi:hypothetical protein
MQIILGRFPGGLFLIDWSVRSQRNGRDSGGFLPDITTHLAEGPPKESIGLPHMAKHTIAIFIQQIAPGRKVF